jgi:hypothetical protein
LGSQQKAGGKVGRRHFGAETCYRPSVILWARLRYFVNTHLSLRGGVGCPVPALSSSLDSKAVRVEKRGTGRGTLHARSGS